MANNFQVRKNFFPPRPKRKRKNKIKDEIKSESNSQPCSQVDSGIETGSQTSLSSQNYESDCVNTQDLPEIHKNPEEDTLRTTESDMARSLLKRRAESFNIESKRSRNDFSDPENSDIKDGKVKTEVSPLVKMISDPELTVETSTDTKGSVETGSNTCMTCEVEEKSAVFVHGRIAHICCCYKCAMKVWARTKRCPLCNRKVSNVLQVK